MCLNSLLNSLFLIIILIILMLSSIIAYCNLSSSVNVSRNSNRNRRQDDLSPTAVCSELDKVENSPFIVMILLLDSGRLQCMGSIIDRYHVLTAKTCVSNVDAPSLKIVAGFASPYFGKNSQVKFVDKITMHPKMNLAIFTLTRSFTFMKTVKPIVVVGPEKIAGSFESIYNKLKPIRVAGIVLPSKISPGRGSLIPKGHIYQLKSSEIYEAAKCMEKFALGGKENKELDKNLHYCTDGKTGFCWTALGSPAVGIFQDIIVQIGVVTDTSCRYLPPTTKANPPAPPSPDEAVDYTPYEQIRLDWFWHWIKANSFISKEFNLIEDIKE